MYFACCECEQCRKVSEGRVTERPLRCQHCGAFDMKECCEPNLTMIQGVLKFANSSFEVDVVVEASTPAPPRALPERS